MGFSQIIVDYGGIEKSFNLTIYQCFKRSRIYIWQIVVSLCEVIYFVMKSNTFILLQYENECYA